MEKHIKGWDVGFVFTDFTYDCLIEGSICKSLNSQIIEWGKGILKGLRHDELECINIFEDYQKEGVLKPVRIIFTLFKTDPQDKAYVITFCDYNESTTDIITKIISNNTLKTIEWDY